MLQRTGPAECRSLGKQERRIAPPRKWSRKRDHTIKTQKVGGEPRPRQQVRPEQGEGGGGGKQQRRCLKRERVPKTDSLKVRTRGGDRSHAGRRSIIQSRCFLRSARHQPPSVDVKCDVVCEHRHKPSNKRTNKSVPADDIHESLSHRVKHPQKKAHRGERGKRNQKRGENVEGR